MKRATLRFNVFVQLGLVFGIVVLLSLLGGRYSQRLDLTEDRIYSLSPTSKRLMKALDRPLVVKVFFTGNLPAPYNNHEQVFVEKLEEFQAWSKGRMRIELIDPTEEIVEVVDGKKKKRTRQDEAMRLGLMPRQMAFGNQTRKELRQVYMGAVFLYGNEQVKLPVIDRLGGLEYEIARRVRRLLDPEPKRVGYTMGHGEQDLSSISFKSYQIFKTGLQADNRTLVPVDLEGPVDQLEDLDAILVMGPSSRFSELASFRLDQFMMSGRSVAMLLSNYGVAPNKMEVRRIFHGLEKNLGTYGIRHNQDLVLDRESNARWNTPIKHENGMVSLEDVDNPALPVIQQTKLSSSSPIVQGIPFVTMPFSSSLTVVSENNPEVVYTAVAMTSDKSVQSQVVKEIDQYSLKRSTAAETQGSVPVIVSAQGVFPSAFAGQEAPDPGEGAPEEIVISESAPTRLVVAGTGNMVLHNPIVLLNLVDWLVADASLYEIRSKMIQLPQMEPLEKSRIQRIKLMNLLGPTFLLLLFGGFRMFLRRRRA